MIIPLYASKMGIGAGKGTTDQKLVDISEVQRCLTLLL